MKSEHGTLLMVGPAAIYTAILVIFAFCKVSFAADLPLLSTTDDTFNLGCQLAFLGEGDEMCFIIDTIPPVELVCGTPDAGGIFRADLDVIKGQTTYYRCYTKLGTVQSENSVDAKPVEGIPLPPTVVE
jgi:hypothetical protein